MPKAAFARYHEGMDYQSVLSAYQRAQDGRQKERLLMVLLSLEGKTPPEIARLVHRYVDTVRYWLSRWNQAGSRGLADQPHPGRRPLLNESQRQQVIEWVVTQVSQKGRVTCREIAQEEVVHGQLLWVTQTQNQSVSPESLRRLLQRQKCSWQKAGTRDHRANPEEQKVFVEQLYQRMEDEPNTRFFFCDEAIFQVSTNTTYTWAKKGERPLIPTNLSHEQLIQIGAVEPTTGESFHLFIPFTTKASFQVFVFEFARTFTEGKIVLIKDGASWHQIQSPQAHIELWTLPPYSPELNPIERFWEWLRENFLNNRFFASRVELEAVLTQCLRNLQGLKQAIKSVCTLPAIP